MAIWNLGSVNADLFYRVPHIPAPGETIAALSMTRGLGGKGANMSVAAARAGARTHHIGNVGTDGIWARDRLMEYGVDTRFIDADTAPMGHAIITVDEAGENAITLFSGANHQIAQPTLTRALSEAATGDWFLTQNETTDQAEGAALARDLGLRVAYAAAPFDARAVQAVLPLLDLLILNTIEAAQLEEALSLRMDQLGVADVIVTLGAEGARHITPTGHQDYPAIPADVVDTTGAGDTFTGFVLAGLDRGFTMAQSIRLASFAGALMVARHGTADVIPDLHEVETAMRSAPAP